MFSRFPLRAHCRSSINPLGSRPAIRCTSNHNSPQSDTPLAGNVGFLPRGPDVGPFSWCGVPNENGPRSEDGEPLCSNPSGARRPFGPALPRTRSVLGVTGVLGAGSRHRTRDHLLTKQLLCRLSYTGLTWLREPESNRRPSGYEHDALPAALPRDCSGLHVSYGRAR